MEHLSDEWVDAVVRATHELAPDPGVASGDSDAATSSREVVVQVVVEPERTDEDALTYHLAVGPNGLRAGRGRHPRPTVTISQSRATAVALAGGELSAQTAFMAGRLRIRGQAAELLGTADAFRAFDQVMRAVADRTER